MEDRAKWYDKEAFGPPWSDGKFHLQHLDGTKVDGAKFVTYSENVIADSEGCVIVTDERTALALVNGYGFQTLPEPVKVIPAETSEVVKDVTPAPSSEAQHTKLAPIKVPKYRHKR